jgi:hypothetical protein
MSGILASADPGRTCAEAAAAAEKNIIETMLKFFHKFIAFKTISHHHKYFN